MFEDLLLARFDLFEADVLALLLAEPVGDRLAEARVDDAIEVHLRKLARGLPARNGELAAATATLLEKIGV